MRLQAKYLLPLIALILVGCERPDTSDEVAVAPVRGLKTFLIEEQQKTSVRRYPSVLQPSEITPLSFEIAGKLGENKLQVGQRVEAGEILVALDRRSLELVVENAQAVVSQMKATTAPNRAPRSPQMNFWRLCFP